MQAASIETSNIALQAAMEVFNEGAPMPSWLLELLTASLVAEEPSVVATASYKLQLHGRLDAHSAAVLERKVLRGCWIRFRELRQREAPGPAADAVLQRQASLGAGIAELLSKAAFLGCASQGRLAVRRLHRMEGTFDASCSLAAKSVPAWVESQLSLQLPSSSSAGRIVGHRSGTLDVWSPILADHDRSQHAERQALLLLLGDLDHGDTGPVPIPPAGGIRLYVSAHPCVSCTAVFFQLASSWRGVRLQVAFDAWEETKRWTASLAPEAWQEGIVRIVNDNCLTEPGTFSHIVSLKQLHVGHVAEHVQEEGEQQQRLQPHPIEGLAEKSTAAADTGGVGDLGSAAAEKLLASRVAELEAQLAEAQRSSTDAREACEAMDGSATRARVRDLEAQLARAEENAASLKEAASRAAERLQEQAVKERQLERQLADSLGSSWPLRSVIGAVEGVSNTVRAATGRCMRPSAAQVNARHLPWFSCSL
ncbi:osm1 [Symbiodinium sp. KB8]|nr:osm1 [Symbiodinium sp. KB8]